MSANYTSRTGPTHVRRRCLPDTALVRPGRCPAPSRGLLCSAGGSSWTRRQEAPTKARLFPTLHKSGNGHTPVYPASPNSKAQLTLAQSLKGRKPQQRRGAPRGLLSSCPYTLVLSRQTGRARNRPKAAAHPAGAPIRGTHQGAPSRGIH